jgi:hypothetical protein
MKEPDRLIHRIMPLLVASLLGVLALVTQLQAQQPALPTGEFPAPTGPYRVGRTVFDWIDTKRRETLSKDPSARRELMVYVFYPSDAGQDGKPAAYMPYIEAVRAFWVEHYGANSMKENLGDAYDRLFSLKAHAVENATLSEKQRRYPVLVFQPGLGYSPLLFTSTAEDLASHGYVVAAIDPTYESNFVPFPDGRVMDQSDKYDTVFTKGSREESARFHHERLNVNAQDHSFVLDQLTGLDTGAIASQHPNFKGRLDTSRAGAFGHSQGGLAARRSCQIDPRWKGCVNLGGGFPDEELKMIKGDGQIKRPFMLIGPFLPRFLAGDLAQFNDASAPSYLVAVEAPGFGHFIFLDLELPEQKRTETRNGLSAEKRLRDYRIFRDYLRAFFNRNLLDEKTDLFDWPPKNYPEVVLYRFPSVNSRRH